MLTDDPADPAEAAACRALWSAVALAALADAELDPTGPAGAYLRTRDFRTVLDLSGLDPRAALERIDRARRARLAELAAEREAEIASYRHSTVAEGGDQFLHACQAATGALPLSC